MKAVLYSCPVIDEVFVSPTTPAIGEATTLSASAHDTNDTPLSYRWSASSGVLKNARTARATLTVTLPGTTELDLVVSNGSCTDHWTVKLPVAEDPGSPDGRSR